MLKRVRSLYQAAAMAKKALILRTGCCEVASLNREVLKTFQLEM